MRGRFGAGLLEMCIRDSPYCITVDFETEQDGCVTVRDRDTMEQERIRIEDVADYLAKKIAF